MEKRLAFPVLLIAVLLFGSGISCQATTEFLFVHGAFHGAWCWYKVVTILQNKGYKATALDMTSNGRDKTIADTVTGLAQYTKPLTDYLANVSGKVVLVGHSLGGVSITYAMEQHPEKISKAIFLAALMPPNNQSLSSSAPPTLLPKFLSEGSITLNFANGPLAAPTSFSPNLTAIAGIFYNLSPAQDVTLSLSLLDNEPYSSFAEVLHLTPGRYGSVRRFFIETDQDNAITNSDSTYIINQNPPEKTFFISGTDHSAFFSKPVELVKTLLDISTLCNL